MLKAALALLLTGGMAAWGQAQNDASSGAVKVDRAAAYYHYTLACMYAEMGPAYRDKAVENYKAAVKADPHAPKPHRIGFLPLLPPLPRLPASRKDH